MYLHQVDAYPVYNTGCGGSGKREGDGQHYVFGSGDGDTHGDSDGDGTGEDEASEWKLLIVEMCVSQMYLLAQVLGTNQGE